MARTLMAFLTLAIMLVFVGTAKAQDRKWSLMQSFSESDDFSVQRIYSGKKIKVYVYLSDITHLSDELIQVEVLQDLTSPTQPGNEPPWRSEGTVFQINCKNLSYKASDVISYQFPMGQKVLERWSDDKYMRRRLANRRWFPHQTIDFMAKIKGEKRPMLISDDIKQLCPNTPSS